MKKDGKNVVKYWSWKTGTYTWRKHKRQRSHPTWKLATAGFLLDKEDKNASRFW